MSIASEITRLQSVKSDILNALAAKGVTVPAGSALDDVPGLVASIPSGGSIDIVPSGGYYVQGKALNYYANNVSGTGVSVSANDLEHSIIEVSFTLKGVGESLMYVGRKGYYGNPIYFMNYGGYLYGASSSGAYIPWGTSPGSIYLPDYVGQKIKMKLYPDGTLTWNNVTMSGGGWSEPDGWITFGTVGFGSGCCSAELDYITVKSATATNAYCIPCKRINVSPYKAGLYDVITNTMYDAVNAVDLIV